MNNQNLVLLALGLFVALIVTVAAVDEYLLNEHPPSEVDGLLWRVENAFMRIRDLEASIEITQSSDPTLSIGTNLRMINGVPPALSLRYLRPVSLKGETITVQNDLLSHYLPQENVVISRRWRGLPLSAVGLAGLDVSLLRRQWEAGDIYLQVQHSVHGLSSSLFPSDLVLSETLAGEVCIEPESFCQITMGATLEGMGFARLLEPTVGNAVAGSHILEVRTAESRELTRMVWIDRDTYFVQKVVFFENGKRSSTIEVQWSEVDQGLTLEDVLTLPNAEDIRG